MLQHVRLDTPDASGDLTCRVFFRTQSHRTETIHNLIPSLGNRHSSSIMYITSRHSTHSGNFSYAESLSLKLERGVPEMIQAVKVLASDR